MTPVPAPAPALVYRGYLIRRLRPRRGEPPAPTQVVRICRDCGAHYIGFTLEAAQKVAAHHVTQATEVMAREEPQDVRTMRSQRALLAAYQALESSNGVCSTCAGKRWEAEGGQRQPEVRS